ncbi:MAG TPA: site-specific DNA-methyltransferase [Acidimicrobiia bacterium]|jgi:site-specific DNA-methyltransferase (adenine-specific)|nr:site-specific DNA-methyltransferase [Acidimicrobiia bacterium]
MPRRPTATSAFGSGRRESHDSTGFYQRFPVPTITPDDEIAPPVLVDRLFVGDARLMSPEQVADRSVALVVTSPPYFTGKDYEDQVAAGEEPFAYGLYLDMLREVFSVCMGKLEPGGKLAVNVANLGRRPYRSLAADLISILQDDLGLLLRGEIVWRKAKGQSGSCAWGSYRSPANPVLRDLTERIIVASKGRFDRAVSRSERRKRGLPHLATITAEEFMLATLDVWEIPSASATRIGHPAPFPVDLPRRLIELYTYAGDLVLDPFVGSGTTAVAAQQTGRHYVGFDIESGYIELATRRLDG